jgi:hypothetical protein
VERYAAKGWGASRGPGLGSDPPPQDPLRPPLRGLEGPGRGGVVGETAPPYPPPYRASQGGSSGRRIGGFCRSNRGVRDAPRTLPEGKPSPHDQGQFPDFTPLGASLRLRRAPGRLAHPSRTSARVRFTASITL